MLNTWQTRYVEVKGKETDRVQCKSLKKDAGVGSRGCKDETRWELNKIKMAKPGNKMGMLRLKWAYSIVPNYLNLNYLNLFLPNFSTNPTM